MTVILCACAKLTTQKYLATSVSLPHAPTLLPSNALNDSRQFRRFPYLHHARQKSCTLSTDIDTPTILAYSGKSN